MRRHLAVPEGAKAACFAAVKNRRPRPPASSARGGRGKRREKARHEGDVGIMLTERNFLDDERRGACCAARSRRFLW